MARKRPWKVRFHYDGTKQFPDCEHDFDRAYIIDTTRPIDGLHAFASDTQAHHIARTVSRNGGSATVFHRDPTTGIETDHRTYQPYETALQELSKHQPT